MTNTFYKGSVTITVQTLNLSLGDPNMTATVEQILGALAENKIAVGGMVSTLSDMATVQENIALDISALKAQIAAGGTVTTADLDNIFSQAQDSATSAQSGLAAAQAALQRLQDLDAQTP